MKTKIAIIIMCLLALAAYASFDKNAKIFQRARSSQGDSFGKIHPTQKPIKLYDWLLANYAKPDQFRTVTQKAL